MRQNARTKFEKKDQTRGRGGLLIHESEMKCEGGYILDVVADESSGRVRDAHALPISGRQALLQQVDVHRGAVVEGQLKFTTWSKSHIESNASNE